VVYLLAEEGVEVGPVDVGREADEGLDVGAQQAQDLLVRRGLVAVLLP
jgi:hypothetical protein